MSDSTAWSPSDYIKEFIQIDSKRLLVWRSESVIRNALLATVITMKRCGQPTEEVERVDGLFSYYFLMLKVFGLLVLKECKEKDSVADIIYELTPIESAKLVDQFRDTYKGFVDRLSRRASSSAIENLNSFVAEAYEPVLMFTWHVLEQAHRLGIEDELISELHLMQEIEVFRNSKDKFNEQGSDQGD